MIFLLYEGITSLKGVNYYPQDEEPITYNLVDRLLKVDYDVFIPYSSKLLHLFDSLSTKAIGVIYPSKEIADIWISSKTNEEILKDIKEIEETHLTKIAIDDFIYSLDELLKSKEILHIKKSYNILGEFIWGISKTGRVATKSSENIFELYYDPFSEEYFTSGMEALDDKQLLDITNAMNEWYNCNYFYNEHNEFKEYLGSEVVNDTDVCIWSRSVKPILNFLLDKFKILH